MGRRRAWIAFIGIAGGASAVSLVIMHGPWLTPASLPSALAAFPATVVSVGFAGLGATAIDGGPAALRRLGARLDLGLLRTRWLLAILVPPAAVLAVLTGLQRALGPAYAPGFFPIGVAFGLAAAAFEEIGWTGFAFPRLRDGFGIARGGLLLGVVWAVWHLPVVDALGSAAPHGSALPVFAAAFGFALVGLRLFIVAAYESTGSLVLAQAIHASSTASLVVLGAQHVRAVQEALWYGVYGLVLWSVAIALLVKRRRTPVRSSQAMGRRGAGLAAGVIESLVGQALRAALVGQVRENVPSERRRAERDVRPVETRMDVAGWLEGTRAEVATLERPLTRSDPIDP
jgi:uncharacterized protein